MFNCTELRYWYTQINDTVIHFHYIFFSCFGRFLLLFPIIFINNINLMKKFTKKNPTKQQKSGNNIIVKIKNEN